MKLRFGGSLVEQLGAQLYPSATATVAELISNSWDADAANVWIQVPFGESWTPDSEIVVVDDGNGMTRAEAEDAYLVVGRKRRVAEGTDESPGGRKLHGRKGIGKLAAFGTARILECTTWKGSEGTAFRLDYDAIRHLEPAEDYEVEEMVAERIPSPDGDEPLEHGTRVRLTGLWLKRALAEEQFMPSMSRRFAIAQAEMRVMVNETQLQRFDIPVEFRFPRDGAPDGVTAAADEWAEEDLGDGRVVRWWMGFTATPIQEDYLKGVSVLSRGKMAQRPFSFERSQGTTGQLGQEYLVGEVSAEWLDVGLDIEDDLIQSNRDQLQLEDQKLEEFLKWGQRRLEWALRQRNELRKQGNLAAVSVNPEVEELLKEFTPLERQKFRSIANIASGLPEATSSDVVELMRSVVASQSDRIVRELMEEIAQEEDAFQARMWELVQKFGLIDARRTLTLIEARLRTIEQLQDAVENGAREVPELHRILRDDPWLLDPRWQLYDDEVDLQKEGLGHEAETDQETGQIIDYRFILQPNEEAPLDEVIVVEIKRGAHKDGKVRRADLDEVDKFYNYVITVQEHYQKSGGAPIVRGLMVAEDYTKQGDTKRKKLEQQAVDPRVQFKTWKRVMEDTRRMHLGWLRVSEKRTHADETTSGEAASEAETSS